MSITVEPGSCILGEHKLSRGQFELKREVYEVVLKNLTEFNYEL